MGKRSGARPVQTDGSPSHNRSRPARSRRVDSCAPRGLTSAVRSPELSDIPMVSASCAEVRRLCRLSPAHRSRSKWSWQPRTDHTRAVYWVNPSPAPLLGRPLTAHRFAQGGRRMMPSMSYTKGTGPNEIASLWRRRRGTPGLLDDKGRIHALSSVIDDLTADSLSPTKLREIGKLSVDKLPIVPGTPRLGTPYRGVGKFIAVGLNYSDHAAESGLAVPAEPVIFSKATSCIVGPNDDIMLPKGSEKTDWEVELGVV